MNNSLKTLQYVIPNIPRQMGMTSTLIAAMYHNTNTVESVIWE